jgi:hypothetical protein
MEGFSMAKKRVSSRGDCKLCGQQFAKSAITRHLANCLAEHETFAAVGGKGTSREIFHFRIEGGPAYWLHLETAADSRFAALDGYLRAIWLECCGHCSAFRLPQPKPAVAARGKGSWAALLGGFDDIDTMMRDDEAVMNAKLASRVKEGDTFHYEYDFGSTTELKLTVVGKREGMMKPDEVLLLARNLPPDIRCQCGKPAVWICSECAWDGNGWLCKACGKKHGCGDEMFLPVVNSPRVGVCAYSGPADESLN